MKTHKVDVISGYSYPQDNHALWFDESQNVLKKYDGTKWVSGSAVNNEDRNYEKNFYTKEETVPPQVIWEGNAHSGDRIENFIQEPVAGESYTFELSDGRTFDANWVDKSDFVIYSVKGVEEISIGYRVFGGLDYGWEFIHEVGNDSNLVKISTAETTQDVLVWNYQDSLPIAMPKCIEDDELGFVAVFDNRPEEGRAYYIPEDDVTFVPVLIGEYTKKSGISVVLPGRPIPGNYYYLSECSGEFQILQRLDNKYYAYIIDTADTDVPGESNG